MIFIDELKFLLDNVPTLLQYFVPGYWAIFVFKYFSSKQLSDYMNNIMACVVSYILIAGVSLLRSKWEWISVIPDMPIINSAISILIGTALAFIMAIIVSSKLFSRVTVFLFNKTPNNDIWRDILDFKNGSNLKIYLKDEEYYVIGHHKNHEEKDGDSWLAVSAFAKYDKISNTNYKNEPSFLNDENVIYTVRFSDIEHIEIF